MDGAQDRLLTPAFVALTAAELSYFTAVGVLLATTPLFVTGPLTGGAAAVGLVMGSASVSTLLLRPLAGRWADRSGRRRLLVGGVALFTVLVLGHLVVESVIVLVGLRILLGVAEALFFVAGFAALADLAPPGRAGEALSINSLGLYLGLAVGPVIGQLLLRWRGFDAVWTGAAVLAVVATTVALSVPETRAAPPPEGAAPSPLVHPAALIPGAALFTAIAATSGFLAFAVIHARSLGIERWSGVLLLYGLTVVGCRIVLAKLPDRVGPVRLSAAALLATAIGLAVVGVLRSPTGLLAGTAVVAVGVALVTPGVFAAVFGAVPAAERGSAAATTSIFIDLGLGAGPLLLGVLAAATSVPLSFVWAAMLPFAGYLLLAGAGRAGRIPVTPAAAG